MSRRPDTTAAVLHQLRCLADPRGCVTVSMRNLAARSELSLSAVYRVLHALIADGAVQLVEPGQRAVGRGMNARAATYRVSDPDVSTLPEVAA